MTKKCTCIRCQAEELVRNIYPDIESGKAEAVAQKIVNAMRSAYQESKSDKRS